MRVDWKRLIQEIRRLRGIEGIFSRIRCVISRRETVDFKLTSARRGLILPFEWSDGTNSSNQIP